MQVEGSSAAAAQPASAAQEPPHDTQVPDGLTPLHLAVIKNDRAGVRELLAEREIGVDVPTFRGATPLMMACLFGRSSIFSMLINKRASTVRTDYDGLGLLDYVKHVTAIENNLHNYQVFTGQQPSPRGRKTIYDILRVCIQAARDKKRLQAQDTRADGMNEVEILPVAQTAPRAEPDMKTVFLRDGRELYVASMRVLETTKFSCHLGRKSCGAVRGKAEEKKFKMIAISGWRGDTAEGAPALCNKTYSSLARRLCALYGLKLPGNQLDRCFKGDPLEKAGAFASCHAEKLLAIWVLEEAVFHTKQTRDLTRENIADVKLHVDQLPSDLRETVVELDHEPCKSCINFLNLIRDKAGLQIEWQPRTWFTRGTRPRLRYVGDLCVTEYTKADHLFVDEIDEDYVVISDEDINTGAASAAATDDDDDSNDHNLTSSSSLSLPLHGLDGTQSEPEPTTTPPSMQQKQTIQRSQRAQAVVSSSSPLSQYSKHASPVSEWPQTPVANRARALRLASSARRRALRTTAAPGSAARPTSSAGASKEGGSSSSSPSVPVSAGSGAVTTSGSAPTATPGSAANSAMPASSKDGPCPLQLALPTKLTTSLPVRSSPEVLDQAILDGPVTEPFPNASNLKLLYSGKK